MSYAAAKAELEGRLKANWSATPIDWPNTQFDPPNPPAPWLRSNINEGDASRLTIGASTNSYRHPGVYTLQLFDALNVGDGPLTALADQAAALFQSWYGVNVVCRTATVRTIGDDGKGWYQINVIIPFYWDDLK